MTYLVPVLSVADDLPPVIEHAIAGEFVLLPAGEFMMGAAKSDPESLLDEQPVTR